MTLVHAYGYATEDTILQRRIQLPRGALAHVSAGQNLNTMDVVGVYDIPGEHRLLDVSKALNVRPRKAVRMIQVLEGQSFSEDDILAERSRFLRKPIKIAAPFSGKIVTIDNGLMLLESRPSHKEVVTPVPGRVISAEHGSHVTMETRATRIQLAWGHGTLAAGLIRVLDDHPTEQADPARFNIDHRAGIVVTGGTLTPEFIAAAEDIRVRALIAPSATAGMRDHLMSLPFGVGLIQGFGTMPISETVLNLLQTYQGNEASLDLTEAGDWRENRPEIIIPIDNGVPSAEAQQPNIEPLWSVGTRVRLLQEPHLGEFGKIRAMPPDLLQFDRGVWAQGAHVELQNGSRIYVPLMNLEYLS